MKRKIFRRFAFCVELPLCIIISVISFILILFKRASSAAQGRKSIVFLSSASSIEEVYKKFGNMEFLFDYDGEISTFDRFHVFWLEAPSTCYGLRLKDNFEITQFKRGGICSLMPFLGFSVKFLKILFFTDKSVRAVRSFSAYYPVGPMGVLLSKALGVPLCVSVHADYEKRHALQGNVITPFLGSVERSRRLEKKVYETAKLVLPIRESLKECLVRAGCDEKKIRVFPHGIDLSPFKQASMENVRSVYNLPDDSLIVSSAGRIEKENYCFDIAEIAARCVEKNDKLYFIICGGGAQLENVKSRVAEAGLTGRILLPGFVEQLRVFEIRRQSAVNLCLMAGFSLIEACAAGRPVISYDVEWHYELVKNGETGFLLPENDVPSAVEKIEFLIENPVEADRMGAAAAKLSFERHSLETTYKIKEAIYEELLGKKK